MLPTLGCRRCPAGAPRDPTELSRVAVHPRIPRHGERSCKRPSTRAKSSQRVKRCRHMTDSNQGQRICPIPGQIAWQGIVWCDFATTRIFPELWDTVSQPLSSSVLLFVSLQDQKLRDNNTEIPAWTCPHALSRHPHKKSTQGTHGVCQKKGLYFRRSFPSQGPP